MTKVKRIEWSEEFEANKECRYNHCIGKTPLGDFLITWKGWKSYGSVDVEENPFNDLEYWFSAFDLQEAKEYCEEMFAKKIAECLEE